MSEEVASTADRDWAAADPGANMRIGGSSRRLCRALRADVVGMQRRAAGRVLDIRGPLAGGFEYESVRELVVAPPGSLGDSGDDPFDTVCSFGAMAAAPHPEALVATLRPLLAPGGLLLFVELDGDARPWRRRLDRMARRLWGMSMAGDISGALWAGGFEVVSLERRWLRSGRSGSLRVVVGAARPDLGRADLPDAGRGAVESVS